jgi:lipopolysaccharide biosynthesis glycosyltransferase
MMSERREAISLISAANSKFFPGLLVALATAIEQASGQYDYNVIVLNGGITDDEIHLLTEKLCLLGQFCGIQVKVENRILTLEELSILPSRRGSPLTNARLLVPKLFPELDKAVYLDSDVLCMRGVEEFYQALDEKSALSACLDPHGIMKRDRTTRTKIPREKWQMPYFNAGVIGINLKRWRIDFNRIAELLTDRYEWKHADQSLLNFLYCGEWNRVPPEANVCLTLRNCAENDFLEKKVNIHYIGPVKPWLSRQSMCYRYEVDLMFDVAMERLLGSQEKRPRTVNARNLERAKKKRFWYRFLQPSRSHLYRMVVQRCAHVSTSDDTA